MAAFPHSYAKILAEGYEKDRASALVRTPMEDGMTKQLKVRSRVLVGRSFVVAIANLSDYQSFITWFQTTINYGADWFDFTDPEDSVVRTARVVNKLDKERPIVGLGQWRIPIMIETWSG
jgi:hypothetical protein